MSLTSLYSVLLLVVFVAVPMAVAVAQVGTLRGLLDLFRIQGIVYCTSNGNIGSQGLSTPTFPNAAVQMRCGSGLIVSSVQTNETGSFSMLLNPAQMVLSFLLSNCSLIVTTPLSNCNIELPSFGLLESQLQAIGNAILGGLFNVTNIVPIGFQFQPSH